MATVSDVVIVGGGIAGASLAYALASDGVGVTVLEATVEFQDRVRGESMNIWGVQEARELGVDQILLDAGAHIAPTWRRYTAGMETTDVPVAFLAEGISGTMNLRHPDACQTLIDAAAQAGATVVRGVRDVRLTPGSPVTVSYAVDGASDEVTAPLVVGADGRASGVRKQSGIELHRQEPMSYIAGVLLDGLHDTPDDHDVIASEGDLFLLLFHQGNGRARAYVCMGCSEQKRFVGPQGLQRFLEAWDISCYPWAEQVRLATPAGPCATYPGDDTWTDTPFVEGVVLIGDAAGHNDPIIGQGLSIAMRDARIVRDLMREGARTPSDFVPYGAERFTRMERVRFLADVVAVFQCEDADNRTARLSFLEEKMRNMDSDIFPLIIGLFIGPETIPQELLDASLFDRIRSLS